MKKTFTVVKKIFNDFSLFPKLSIRSISFIGILIAISVVIFVVFASFVPFISIPTYKISFIGLPIKISGFIFGPLVGGIVGLISDIVSFSLFPTFYSVYYTLSAVVDGVIAGLIGWIFLKILRYAFGGEFRDASFAGTIYKYKRNLEKIMLTQPQSSKIKKIQNKIILISEKRKHAMIAGSQRPLLNVNLLLSFLILSLVCLLIYFMVFEIIDLNVIKKYSVIPNRTGLFAMMAGGYVAMLLFLFIARFKMKPKRYLVIVPIVIFSALIELINVPLLSLADYNATSGSGESGSIITYMFQHIIFSPVKIWFNMFIIFFTYNVINPLVNKNESIVY
ncbi:ECF transporter S component [Mycoplasmopsis primatum]|uniref:ECF transporter S component n=1 Tax=Mycoplasmopsis primatum TaxID=55604 RepID=UPI0004983C94|nr:ECF transporter S component [Mycoplasmopsis primatum]